MVQVIMPIPRTIPITQTIILRLLILLLQVIILCMIIIRTTTIRAPYLPLQLITSMGIPIPRLQPSNYTFTSPNSIFYSLTNYSTYNQNTGSNVVVSTGYNNNTVTAYGSINNITLGDGNNTINFSGDDNTLITGNGTNTITYTGYFDTTSSKYTTAVRQLWSR